MPWQADPEPDVNAPPKRRPGRHRRAGPPTRRNKQSPYNPALAEEWSAEELRRLYYQEGKSLKQLAAIYGVKHQRIAQVMDVLGLKQGHCRVCGTPTRRRRKTFCGPGFCQTEWDKTKPTCVLCGKKIKIGETVCRACKPRVHREEQLDRVMPLMLRQQGATFEEIADALRFRDRMSVYHFLWWLAKHYQPHYLVAKVPRPGTMPLNRYHWIGPTDGRTPTEGKTP